jgi:hypothetical protein
MSVYIKVKETLALCCGFCALRSTNASIYTRPTGCPEGSRKCWQRFISIAIGISNHYQSRTIQKIMGRRGDF